MLPVSEAVVAGREHLLTEHSTYGGEGPPAAHLDGFEQFGNLSDVRFGVFRAHFDDVSPVVKAAADSALARLRALGAQIVEIAIPNMHALSVAHGMAISVEFSAAHDREFGAAKSGGQALEPSTRVQLALGSSMTGVEFLAANRLKSWVLK